MARDILRCCSFRVRQNGTREFDYLTSVLEAENGAIVMSGSTEGSFSRSNADLGDVMAIKLDASGSEQWRWQVSQDSSNDGDSG